MKECLALARARTTWVRARVREINREEEVMADIEVAPIGTRKLLEEVAKVLRGYEKHHRDRAAEYQTIAKDKHPEPDAGAFLRDSSTRSIAKADANARIAGRIEAHLFGWEIMDLTLDEATARFEADPSSGNGQRLVAVARQYAADEMIAASEADVIAGRVERETRQ